MSKRIYFFLFLFIFLLALFLRFYQLGVVPNGLNQDETSIGYNAYAISQTGKDEYGKQYPLYFKSFGDQKLPVYIYLTVISEKLFGINAFAVRFFSAFLGSLTILFFFLLVKNLSKNRDLALLSAGLLAINPWHLFFSRAAFEVNIALFFAVFGTWSFFKALETKRKMVFFTMAIISFLLCLYSYSVTRLLAPLLVLLLVGMQWKEVKKIPFQRLLILSIFLLIGLVPFLFTFFSNAGVSSTAGTLITSTDIQAKAIEMRSYVLLYGPSPLMGLFFNKYLTIAFQYLQNVVGFFSPSFFFISGSEHVNQGIGNMGMFYLFEFPLIIAGIIFLFRLHQKSVYLFVYWLVITILVGSLSKDVPHATRAYFLVIPLSFFSAYGLYYWIFYLNHMKHIKMRYILACISIGICSYTIVYYFISYYIRFPYLYAQPWRSEEKAIALYLQKNEGNYKQIIIDRDTGISYSSLLFYQKFPSEKFVTSVVRLPDESKDFSYVASFGKYVFKYIDWKNDGKAKDTLLITAKKDTHATAKAITSFYYPRKPLVLSVKEVLLQAPQTPIAYVVYDSNKKKK